MSDDESNAPEYKPPKQTTINDLINQDAEDESLRKYKASLLGNVGTGVSPKDDPRRVVVKEMKIIFEDRPGDKEIVYNLETKEGLEKLKATPFVLKENCHYKIQVTFLVQHEIVSGLKQVLSVYRKGIKVATTKTMLGSFGPQVQPHSVISPRQGWEEAPSGLLARGSYTAKLAFVDDDGVNHLEFEYAFGIKSDWKSSD